MCEKNISVIDVKGISAPVTKLIEVLENASGVIFEPTRIRRKAKAKADARVIAVKAEIEITEIQQRGLTRLVYEEGKKQEHLEKIIEQSIPDVQTTAKPENIDPDWLYLFIEKAKNISSPKMQLLWSKILSGEVNNKGAFSKRTLEFLSTIEKKEAELFTKLCGYTIIADTSYPIVDNLDSEFYKKKGITYDSLSHLDDIGLVKLAHGGEYQATEIEHGTVAFYFSETIPMQLKNNCFHVRRVLFSNIGKELFPISGAKFDQEIYQYLTNKFKEVPSEFS